jgi:hypothetical protein
MTEGYIMRKRAVILILMMVWGSVVSLAQDPNVQNNDWLVLAVIKLENSRDRASANIRRYEGEIQKCDATISKSESILSLARQQGNARAEEIAREALAKARAARLKNTELKEAAEVARTRAEGALSRARNALSDAPHSRIASLMTECSGRVSLKKPSGETREMGKGQEGFIEKGDEISTFENGTAELQFFDGRGTLIIGENSRIKMEEDEAGLQAMRVLEGKANFKVDKLEDYQRILEERIEAYKGDLETVSDELKQKAMQELSKLRAFAKKFEVRTPPFVASVRGTEFVVLVDERTGSELIVLEGSVEMRSQIADKVLIIEAGYKSSATTDRILSEPEKVEVSRIERWWEGRK